ncbi:hypothetical protein PLESTB_001398600 [Pleodorina starrii]|uniref:Uncharacterized protein n=1 Tax=Pleodorina starrii TaxID=330485 RepID=A0A9W6BV35_9CHLO|nr:hypothetical protein PLESTM_000533700 [Pleodorina starrii]GLC58764.1 hypothetical protein PLESTB_001398600 [Pleodorina starrii]GLC68696.1 hypothetical protein PLESTF_000725400 [Pleodorina starrii]
MEHEEDTSVAWTKWDAFRDVLFSRCAEFVWPTDKAAKVRSHDGEASGSVAAALAKKAKFEGADPAKFKDKESKFGMWMAGLSAGKKQELFKAENSSFHTSSSFPVPAPPLCVGFMPSCCLPSCWLVWRPSQLELERVGSRSDVLQRTSTMLQEQLTTARQQLATAESGISGAARELPGLGPLQQRCEGLAEQARRAVADALICQRFTL